MSSHPLDAWALDPDVRHLNHGSFGAVPRVTLDELRALRTEMETNPCRWFRGLPERVARARTDIARYLRVAPDTLALVPNASAGISTVLSSLELPPGSEVLLTDHSYGAVTMGVTRAAERAGARVRTLHIPLDATPAQIAALFADALGDTGAPTSLVVVDQITSATARLFPVADIVAHAHAAGALVLVDGAHAPGMLADPLADAGEADFWVGNLHKWPCAPRGTAALVSRGDRAQRLHPLTDSWGAPYPFPERFDQQGTVDLTPWLAAPRSLDFIEERFGWDAARRDMAELAGEAQQLLADALGVDTGPVGGSPAPAMRLVPLPDGAASDQDAAHALGRHLADTIGCETAVTTWNGRGFLRLSAHLYNDRKDYAYLADQLPTALAATAS
ncbi:aminotransferase class V-fold PLP-dependent enzyme [Streptomyces sp. NBC_00006]|uniref:aminotransferase class V-fold PLP-dependent enzyme n=1 Tax=unclassified Streptomyces TaxID=2593676 RepID=UPI00224D4C91|nr:MULTISPECIES: aminotransferase class V-fold PLP-dependent enzyme [unclassified Streptomyces]MCX5536980.1 aminotransferase class V-fold PLP-dependent enzyme [Streptomyces sp. NBC_00006]